MYTSRQQNTTRASPGRRHQRRGAKYVGSSRTFVIHLHSRCKWAGRRVGGWRGVEKQKKKTKRQTRCDEMRLYMGIRAATTSCCSSLEKLLVRVANWEVKALTNSRLPVATSSRQNVSCWAKVDGDHYPWRQT